MKKRPGITAVSAGSRGIFVGMTGFEPAASCSQSRRPTGLGYIP